MDLSERDPIQVTFNPPGITLELRNGESVLDGMRRHGFSHRHGCRRGGCGRCKVDVAAGEIGYDVTVAETVLTSEERAAGTALSCRAMVRAGPVVISLRNETLRSFFPWQHVADQPWVPAAGGDLFNLPTQPPPKI